jgi:hypothetical protein
MFKSMICVLAAIFLFCHPLFGEENKEKKDSGKVKAGVEVEKGDNAPAWETEILRKKQERIKKENKEDLKKERKEEIKKERKERKLDQKKEKGERKKQQGK